jgi:excisionase family DNA binding protein
MEYLTITQAARQTGISTKSIQRAIRRGELKAEYPEPNKARIAAKDLADWQEARAVKVLVIEQRGQTHGQTVQTELEQRVRTLERQVRNLEQQVRRLRGLRTAGKKPAEELTELYAFAARHNVSRADVERGITMQLFPLEKLGDGSLLALSSAGQRAFWETFHAAVPLWTACPDCPHAF